MTLILIIAFVLIIIAAGVLPLIIYITLEKRRIIERGIRIYKYSPSTRLIEAKELKKFRHLYRFRKETYGTDKKLINEELSFIFNSSGEKLIRQALHECAKKVDKTSIEFTSKLPEVSKKHEFNIFMSFHQTDDDQYIITIKWKLVTKQRTKISKRSIIKKIDKMDMHLLDAPITGYVVFNIRKESSVEKRLVDIIASIWKKEFKYFVSGGVLAVVFQDETTKKIAANIEKFIQKFKSHGIQLGAHQLYSGSSYAYVVDGNKAEQQNKLFQAMEFFINLSIDKNIDFLTPHKEELVNQEENKKFLEGLSIFKKAVHEKKVEIDYTPVKRYISNKKVGLYVTPKIKGLNDHIQNIIVRNINNKKALINTTAEIVSKARGMDPVLVDVNASWLIKNAGDITNKKVIYVIDVDDRVEIEELRKVLEILVQGKFMFGFRIVAFNERMSVLIKRCNIKFIIIDKQFMANGDLFDSNAYIDLLTIAEFAAKASIQIIYEKPSEFIDKATSEKIGLKYFF